MTGLVALLLAGSAAAETLAIVNARIVTVGPAGEIASGTVVLTDGRITAVGAGVRPPAGARVIDAAGKVVTPGLIAPSTNLMISEVESVRSTRDDQAGAILGPAYDVQYAINPVSIMVPLARQSGVTRAMVTPSPSAGGDGADEEGGAEETAGKGGSDRRVGLYGGQAAAVRLDAGNLDPVFKPKIALTLDMGDAGAEAAGSRGSAMVLAAEALDDARRFSRNRAAFDKTDIPSRYTRADLEALLPVVEGRTPLLVRVHRAADILQVLRFAAREHVRVLLEGAEEGWTVAAELARTQTPVIVDTEADLPGSFETLGSRLDNAARLQAAGVLVSIAGSRDFNNLRQARFNAGTAVANGLPYGAALASLTLNPARMWGVSDRLGSIEVGKEADLVIWSGDPLETSTWPTTVIIAGREQPTTSRGLELRDRYLPQDVAAGRSAAR